MVAEMDSIVDFSPVYFVSIAVGLLAGKQTMDNVLKAPTVIHDMQTGFFAGSLLR